MNQPKISWLLTGLLAFCYTGPGLAQEVSLRSLLQEMTSRETVAQFPSPAYTCRQASSYDRDSVSPDDQTTWYARPGATCNVKPDPAMATQSVAKAITDLVPPLHVEGALEGESLQVLDKTGGVVEVQTATPLGWSDDRQLWWRDGKIGNRLVLEFPVEKAGRYRITANLTRRSITRSSSSRSETSQPASSIATTRPSSTTRWNWGSSICLGARAA